VSDSCSPEKGGRKVRTFANFVYEIERPAEAFGEGGRLLVETSSSITNGKVAGNPCRE